MEMMVSGRIRSGLVGVGFYRNGFCNENAQVIVIKIVTVPHCIYDEFTVDCKNCIHHGHGHISSRQVT